MGGEKQAVGNEGGGCCTGINENSESNVGFLIGFWLGGGGNATIKYI